MPFQKGHKHAHHNGFGGEQRQLYRKFYRDVYRGWKERGQDCIEDMIEDDPSSFVRLVAGMMPKQMTIEHVPSDRDTMIESILALAQVMQDKQILPDDELKVINPAQTAITAPNNATSQDPFFKE